MRRLTWIAMLLVLAAAAALRWHHLAWESVWLDEAYSIAVARGSVTQVLAAGWTDVHPPLHYLALHYWMAIAGTTEAGARSLSVLFDVCTVAATYAVATRFAGRQTGVIAAFFIALSSFHIEFAQEARMYALLGLTSTVSMLGFVSLAATRRVPAFVVYVFATTLMIYTHIHSLFVLAAQGATFVVWWWGDRTGARRAAGPWIGALAAVAVLFSLWVPRLANQIFRVTSAFWIPPPAWRDITGLFVSYAGSGPLAIIGIALAAAGLFGLARDAGAERSGPPPALVLGLWLAAPVILPLVVSLVSVPMFLPKYMIAGSVPFAILAAVGVTRIAGARARALVIVVIALLSVASLTTFYRTQRRDGWRSATALLEARAQPGDLILFYPAFNRIAFDYYRRREDLTLAAFPVAPGEAVPGADVLDARVRATVGGARCVWLVVAEWVPQKTPLAASIGREIPQTDDLVSRWIELFRFERKGS